MFVNIFGDIKYIFLFYVKVRGENYLMGLSRFTIRTSDRRVFRRCLRKWGIESSLRMNLQRKGTEQNINFWFGSGIHFAMEDYFGYNRFGDPRRAFKAYYEAFKEDELPENAAEYYDLGIGMLSYFMEWYPKHNKTNEFQTLWLDDNMNPVPAWSEGGHPAVEQQFFLDLGLKVVVDKKTEQIICELTPQVQKRLIHVPTGRDIVTGQVTEDIYYEPNEGKVVEVLIVPIYYHGTMDRIMVDKYGRWWILDYKTAKSADTNKLDTDDQISAYIWAGSQWFRHQIYGFVYLQLTKDVARPPKRLKNGDLSIDKKQKTTYSLIRQELINAYGAVSKAPMKYIDFLNYFAEQETEEGDRFIRWDAIQRSKAQIISTYNNIMGEVHTMINPNLYLFPNPTRDCIWDCPLRDVCLAMDDNRMDDVNLILTTDYEKRARGEEGEEPEWRHKIKYPDNPQGEVTNDEFKLDLTNMFDIVLPDKYNSDDEDGGL